MSKEVRAGHWQAPSARTIPEDDPRLKLGGVTLGAGTSLAIINGKTLSEGESATIPVKPGSLKIKCLKIQPESVLIAVEGEDSPRVLRLR